MYLITDLVLYKHTNVFRFRTKRIQLIKNNQEAIIFLIKNPSKSHYLKQTHISTHLESKYANTAQKYLEICYK